MILQENLNHSTSNIVVQKHIENEVINKYRTKLFNLIRFRFIQDHTSLRPGKCHLLIGTAGRGKSTFCQSLVHDCAREHPILFYDTENTFEDLVYLYSKKNLSVQSKTNLNVMFEENIRKSIRTTDTESWIDLIRHKIADTGALAFFFDNLTTSSFYIDEPRKQSEIFYKLKDLCSELEVPFFIVAHTRADVRDDQSNFINAEDIRGSKVPSIKSEYMYSFQRLLISDIDNHGKDTEYFFTFIRVIKSRLGDNCMSVYALGFDSGSKEYYKDEKLGVKDVSAMFSKQARYSSK